MCIGLFYCALDNLCPFSLPLGVRDLLQLVLVAACACGTPWLFLLTYLFMISFSLCSKAGNLHSDHRP